MADKPKTRADATNDLPDNTSGVISPQDVRRGVLSAFQMPGFTTVTAGDGGSGSRSDRASAVQSAINRASNDSDLVGVVVPDEYLNYDASSVTFDNSVRMVREGQQRDGYDWLAYGAATGDSTDHANAVQASIDAAKANGGGDSLWPSGDVNIDSDVELKSSVRLVGRGHGASTLSGTGNLRVAGSASGNTSDLSADAERGDKTVTVSDGSLFSAEDRVEIVASTDEFGNSTKEPPRELNTVESVSTNTLTLKYPLSHAYTTGFTDEPSVTVAGTVRKDVAVLDGFLAVNLEMGLCDGVGLNVKSDIVVSHREGASRDVNGEVWFVGTPGVGGNAEIDLRGLSDFEVRLYTYGGGKDGIRLWACADGVINRPQTVECPNRSIWMYQCDNVDTERPRVVGSQSNTSNIELILFDRSRDCDVHDPYMDEPNKTSTVSYFEFRAGSERCRFLGGTVRVSADNNNICTLKESADRCEWRGTKVVPHGSSTSDIDLVNFNESSSGTVGRGIFKMKDIEVESGGNDADIQVWRTTSNFSFNAAYKYIEIANIITRSNSATTIGFTGDGSGSTLEFLKITNLMSSRTVSGAEVIINGPPIDRVVLRDIHPGAGSRDITIANTTQVDISGIQRQVSYTITGATVARIDGVGEETDNAEEPQSNFWQPGDIVDFTDSGDGSGDGQYILLQDGTTWVQLGPEA